MSMCTSRLVRFCTSCFNLSISAPLRPMMIPGRAVKIRTTNLLAARSISIELIPADFSFSFNSVRAARFPELPCSLPLPLRCWHAVPRPPHDVRPPQPKHARYVSDSEMRGPWAPDATSSSVSLHSQNISKHTAHRHPEAHPHPLLCVPHWLPRCAATFQSAWRRASE